MRCLPSVQALCMHEPCKHGQVPRHPCSVHVQFTQVWVNATKTLTQEEAVMEAIFTRGPMTVSVNAEPEDWRFYKSGVYVNKACSPKLKKLDHAVIVSGYVT